MAYCVHGSYYWRTDRAGKRFRYCRICDAVVMPKKPKKPKPVKRQPIVYDGGPVRFGACVHCGCAVEECEC